MTIFHTPRWMWQKLIVPVSSTLRSTPGLFTNDTMWPMEIKWIACGGPWVYQASSNWAHGIDGINRRIQVEVGITQQSDINYVPLFGHAFFAPSKPLRTLWGTHYPGSRFDFPKPFVLGPEEGLNCAVSNIDVATSSPHSWPDPGIIFNGYRVDTRGKRWPVQLSGYYKGDLARTGTSVVLAGPDLHNNGEVPVYLTDFCLFSGDAYTDDKDFVLDKVGWQINPTSGVQWMPNPVPIPAGLIAPLNEMSDYSTTIWPQAWELPPGCKLYPRQSIVFEVTNLMTVGTDLNVNFSVLCDIEVQ